MKSIYVLLISLTLYTNVIHSYNYDDIEKLRTKLEDKYSLHLYIQDIPYSTWELDTSEVKKEEYDDLYNYMLLFDEEFSKYPLSFLTKIRLKAIVFVSYLSINGQARTAVPDHMREILFFDFLRGDHDQIYQRHVFHHEFYHMIEQEINSDVYYKDPNWMKMNLSDQKYGLGGITVQGNSNAYTFSHPEEGFVNLYSKSALEEDKSEIFAALFIKDEYIKLMDWIKKDKILSNKIEYMKSFLIDQDNNFNETYWKELHNISIK